MKQAQIDTLAKALRGKLEENGGKLGTVMVACHAFNGELRGDITKVDLTENADELADVLSNEVLDDTSEELAIDVTVKDMGAGVSVTGYFWRTTDEEIAVEGDSVIVVAEEAEAAAES